MIVDLDNDQVGAIEWALNHACLFVSEDIQKGVKGLDMTPKEARELLSTLRSSNELFAVLRRQAWAREMQAKEEARHAKPKTA